uniref:Uncharacterized protein n=1 Tax=Callithrix jacchus TaxID=9483 RepID=A0A8I3X1U3_CALJA
IFGKRDQGNDYATKLNATHLSWILIHPVLTQGCRLTSFHHEGLLFTPAGRGKWSKSLTSSSHSRVSRVTSADMLWPKYTIISKGLRGEIPTFGWTKNQNSHKHPMYYSIRDLGVKDVSFYH